MEYAGRVRSPESLGRMLQQARLLSRLTQRELAKRLGTTQRYIRELEAGKPSIAMSRLFTALVESNMTMTMTIAMEDDRNG